MGIKLCIGYESDYGKKEFSVDNTEMEPVDKEAVPSFQTKHAKAYACYISFDCLYVSARAVRGVYVFHHACHIEK
jgi:hypothetical protein